MLLGGFARYARRGGKEQGLLTRPTSLKIKTGNNVCAMHKVRSFWMLYVAFIATNRPFLYLRLPLSLR